MEAFPFCDHFLPTMVKPLSSGRCVPEGEATGRSSEPLGDMDSCTRVDLDGRTLTQVEGRESVQPSPEARLVNSLDEDGCRRHCLSEGHRKEERAMAEASRRS